MKLLLFSDNDGDNEIELEVMKVKKVKKVKKKSKQIENLNQEEQEYFEMKRKLDCLILFEDDEPKSTTQTKKKKKTVEKVAVEVSLDSKEPESLETKLWFPQTQDC